MTSKNEAEKRKVASKYVLQKKYKISTLRKVHTRKNIPSKGYSALFLFLSYIESYTCT